MKVNLFGFTLEFTAQKQSPALDAQKCSSIQTPVPCGLTTDTHSTPMTDAAVRQILQTGHHEKVKAEFARQLERKLNEHQRHNGQHPLAV